MNTRQNTKEYIKGKNFLFIVLNKSSNLSLFSVPRPQYFNSHTTSLLTVACNAIPARSNVTFRLTEGKNVNYITPRNVSLGRLWFELNYCVNIEHSNNSESTQKGFLILLRVIVD